MISDEVVSGPLLVVVLSVIHVYNITAGEGFVKVVWTTVSFFLLVLLEVNPTDETPKTPRDNIGNPTFFNHSYFLLLV